MNKKHFLIKLLPNRADFVQTMTDLEKDIMQQHVVYWKEYMEKGIMLVFGPVLDPNGVYGLGIIAVESEDEIPDLLNNDPASKINTYKYWPMMAVVAEKSISKQ